MFEGMSGLEKTTSQHAKAPVLRGLRDPKHVFVAENSKGQILGFLRKSDRPENGAAIEEVYVRANCRSTGLGDY